MRRVFLVRHGPTHAKSMVGWSDIPADLSDASQITRLKAYLPQSGVLVSSDLVRAGATADAIADRHHRLPHHQGLREINFGDWELQRFDEVSDPEHLQAFWDAPGDITAPSGESWNQVSDRVNAAIDAVIAQTTMHDVIVVAHFGAILTQVQRALGITAYEAFAHKIDNLSVTELHWKQGIWQVQTINHVP